MKLTLRLIILAMLSGCAHYQDKPLNSVASIKSLEARNLSNSELQAFFETTKLPKNSPWNLDKLTLAAMFYHPDLAIARAQADAADATNITAAQRPNPTLTLTPTWISNLAAVTPWIFVSTLNIPIETAGKRGYRMDKSQHLSEAANLRIADAAWLVRGRLRLALLEVFAAQESLRLLQQQHEFEQVISQHLQQQQATGEIAETDMLTTQLGVQQSQLALTAADKKLVDSLNLLAAAIGLPVSALTGVELDFSEFKQLPDLNTVAIAKLKASPCTNAPMSWPVWPITRPRNRPCNWKSPTNTQTSKPIQAIPSMWANIAGH